MLYLAEVDKGFGRRTTLQLLAKQQSENNWSPVYDEAIATEEAAKFNSGVLVLVEVTPNRHAQNIREASKQLVTVLHSLSKLQGKARDREQELQELQDSLTFQIQALNKRQLELEEREERAQQIDVEGLEGQQSHIAEQQKAIGQLREEINSKEAELQQREQELEARLQDASGLSGEDAQKLQALLGDLEQRMHAPLLVDSLDAVQSRLQGRWEELESALSSLDSEKNDAQQQQTELDEARQAWRDRQASLQQSQAELTDSLVQLKQQECTLAEAKQRQQALTDAWQRQQNCSQQTAGLVGTYDFIVATGSDVSAAPAISVEDLTAKVEQLRRKYEQYAAQVQQQEQELEQSRTTLADLQKKLEAAAPDDRFDIEMDIDYSKDACKALEEALAPQRERLEQRQQELHQQDAILQRRLGSGASDVPTVEIGPLVTQIDDQQQFLKAEVEALSAQTALQNSVLLMEFLLALFEPLALR
ncbi:MAG: pilus motility taxis protein HmpF, partial [Cyanobacteria bacterium J06648_11]